MNEMKTKLRGVCRGCGKVIIWSAIHRMYRAVSGGYYCPKDGDSKRCQHILEEPKPRPCDVLAYGWRKELR